VELKVSRPLANSKFASAGRVGHISRTMDTGGTWSAAMALLIARRIVLLGVLGCVCAAQADIVSFTNSLAAARRAEQDGDIAAALKIYSNAELLAASKADELCLLSRRFCDLMYWTNSASARKDLLDHALGCAEEAVKADGKNATAHASLAVCLAQSCAFADIKGQLEYSRQFKQEAETALALDPKQDIAYYLLGRWNFAIANVGLLSRAYVKLIYGGLPKASNEAAIKNFQKAIDLAPQRIIHHAGLAMACAAAGDPKTEIAELEKCRALTPTDREDADAQREAGKRRSALGR